MLDYKYALEIMQQEIDNRYISPEIKYAFNASIKALKKQTAKICICETVDINGIECEFEHYRCPNCGDILHQHYKKSKEKMRYKQNHCHNCGQKLDWE